MNSLRLTVIKGLKEYMNVPVIRSNQNVEPPPYPYLSYTIINSVGQNNGTWGKYEDKKDRKPVTQTWSITVQSNDYNESLELAIKAHEWLDHVGTVYLNDSDVIVQSVSGISGRDNLISIEYEYRNGFDVVFWLLNEVQDTTENIGYIETAEIKREN